MSISIVLALFGIVTIHEWRLITSKRLWRHRRALIILDIITMAALAGGLFAVHSGILTMLFAFFSVYRVINMLRIVQDRMHEQYLRRVYVRTMFWLSLLQLAVLAALPFAHLALSTTVTIVVILQLLLAIMVFASTLISLQLSRVPATIQPRATRDLPTVTVAIPARNETQDLIDCLHSLLASTYPKLEIIALDDCSQTATQDIIKRFAHDGVRFIAGEQPRENWLAKNQAYEALTDAASGELILYCGVDTRFRPESISQMVGVLLDKELDMLDILPYRPSFTTHALVLQPLRYWWELALPRFLLSQPASLSTCWLIRRKTLQGVGGFAAVSRQVRPEMYFARECNNRGTYKFAVNPPHIGITNLKQPSEQFHTAIRVRYPELHRRPESVCLLSLIEITCFLAPFVQIPLAFALQQWDLLWASVPTMLLLTATHIIIMRSTAPSGFVVGLFNYPAVALAELYVVNVSMWRYEFGTVDWKGRNICMPVMHVVPRLPELKE